MGPGQWKDHPSISADDLKYVSVTKGDRSRGTAGSGRYTSHGPAALNVLVRNLQFDRLIIIKDRFFFSPYPLLTEDKSTPLVALTPFAFESRVKKSRAAQRQHLCSLFHAQTRYLECIRGGRRANGSLASQING